jgi:hypothetical protein
MKAATHTFLMVFYFTLLSLEILTLLLNDVSLMVALRLFNMVPLTFVYYMRKTDHHRRVFYAWYLSFFATTDTVVFALLILITRHPIVLFLLLFAAVRLIYEYRQGEQEGIV